MIGYHYTTWKAYQLIRETGLQLAELSDRHHETCREVLEFIEDGCIWVYPSLMRGLQQVGQVFYIAIRHDSHHVVCLAVDYPKWHSAAKLAYRECADVETVNLNHCMSGAGLFNHT